MAKRSRKWSSCCSNSPPPQQQRTQHRTAPHRTAPHRTAPHRTAPLQQRHRTVPQCQMKCEVPSAKCERRRAKCEVGWPPLPAAAQRTKDARETPLSSVRMARAPHASTEAYAAMRFDVRASADQCLVLEGEYCGENIAWEVPPREGGLAPQRFSDRRRTPQADAGSNVSQSDSSPMQWTRRLPSIGSSACRRHRPHCDPNECLMKSTWVGRSIVPCIPIIRGNGASTRCSSDGDQQQFMLRFRGQSATAARWTRVDACPATDRVAWDLERVGHAQPVAAWGPEQWRRTRPRARRRSVQENGAHRSVPDTSIDNSMESGRPDRHHDGDIAGNVDGVRCQSG